MRTRHEKSHRLDRRAGASLRNWEKPTGPAAKQMRSNAYVDMGWGRLIFAHTFDDLQSVVDLLCEEKAGRRDLAFYLRDPHVVLAMAPHRLFLDPSHTYRMWTSKYQPSTQLPRGFHIRRLRTAEDAEAINRIYAQWNMVTASPDFLLDRNANRLRTTFLAETNGSGRIVGAIMGVDHVEAFNDPENGASFWCLAVDSQCEYPGVGEHLVRHIIEHYQARGREYIDLSVIHDNEQAIALYENLGFERVPVFCVKHRNVINESLYIPFPESEEALNPYARIIVDEARRRGIVAEVLDAKRGYFRLHLGGRSVVCRESLTELTSAIAMSRCDDKSLTRDILIKANLKVPAQEQAMTKEHNQQFLANYSRIVVKPARGEQGVGITVDVRNADDLQRAVDDAVAHCEHVILEEFVEGEDLRVIVINNEVVAAAVRRPPVIVGTGRHTIGQLIEKYNRRRSAATGGESRVPLDQQTDRILAEANLNLESVLPADQSLCVRKTANLHTGGTIHDVTDKLHPTIVAKCVEAAKALEIPVVGLDLLVPDVAGDHYVIIEANERPGLANHEPAPTAQRFVDFLFPMTAQQVSPIPAKKETHA